MILTKAVKSTALALLKEKWFWACIVSIIPLFCLISVFLIEAVLFEIMGVFAIIINFLLNFFLTSLLFLGALRVFWRSGNNVDDPINAVFYYFSSKKIYFKAISFVFHLLLEVLRRAVVLFIPSVILLVLSDGKIFETFGLPIPLFTVGLRDIGYLLLFIAVIILLVKCLNLYCSAFLFVANDDLQPAGCISAAKKISKHTKSIYTSHIFGYLGWILLSLFVLPIVFTLPYLLMSYTVDCRYCISYYNRLAEEEKTAPVYSF